MQFEARWWWIVARFRLSRVSVCIDPIRLTSTCRGGLDRCLSPALIPWPDCWKLNRFFFSSFLIILVLEYSREADILSNFPLRSNFRFSVECLSYRDSFDISTVSFAVDTKHHRSEHRGNENQLFPNRSPSITAYMECQQDLQAVLFSVSWMVQCLGRIVLCSVQWRKGILPKILIIAFWLKL